MAEFRKLHPNDLSQVIEISKTSSFGKAWGAIQLSEEILREESYASFDSDRLVSFVFYRKLVGGLEILWLATHPDFLKQSRMKQLLSQFFSSLQRPQEIWLEVSEDNAAASQLYLAMGFERVGVRPRYYSTGKDAHLYSLKL